VWEATIDGRPLHFHLAGINNQNFIMRDEETGSWWQQVSGAAIFGPLKGKRLKPVLQDELSFATWRGEHPNGRVLRPDPAVREYEPKDWEAHIARLPLVIRANNKRLDDRELVIGITIGNHDKAYPLKRVLAESPIIDVIGTTPIVILAGEDGKSVRAFERGKRELFKMNGAFVDASGERWDFTGRSSRGEQLRPVPILKDYWFDWDNYHPRTRVY
jgi:hypothetical protein